MATRLFARARPLLSRGLCAASAGRHHTPIVDALWKKRAQIQAASPPADKTPDERVLISKPPSESKQEMTYTFSSDPDLADTYRNPWGNVRVGRLLEDLDALAGTIAFEHCRTPGEEALLLVTASSTGSSTGTVPT